MKILSYNIQYSKGADDVFDLERTANVIKGADIVGLQEVARNLPGVPETHQPERISQLLPEYFTCYGPAVDVDAGSSLKGGKAVSKRLNFGNMILSRWPIVSTRNFVLPWSGLENEPDIQNCALEAVIDAPGGAIRVYCVHLNYRRSSVRREQMEWLVEKTFGVAQEGIGVRGYRTDPNKSGTWLGVDVAPTPKNFIVLGDFNFTPECAEYSIGVGEDDFQYGRFVVHDRWVDSWTQAGHENADTVSWYDDEAQKGIKLDYGFVSPDLAGRVQKAWIDSDCPASDHQPYWFELV